MISIIAFASTNMNDIFILMIFYGNKKLSYREILSRQLLGIGALTALSLLALLAGLTLFS